MLRIGMGATYLGGMLPNFIVIGAAKAGTTALYWYFAEHPEIFMSPVKETNYFAYEVDIAGQLVYGDPEDHQFPVRSRAEYEQLFAPAGAAKAVGEASPIYLECPQAAGRIRSAIPGALLVCCLRQPVDRAYSDYLMHLRSHGQRLDPVGDLTSQARWAQPHSHWMRISRYYTQLKAYFDAFPRSQIHVILFDDLKRNPLGLMQDLYRFVGVDPTFVPDLGTPHNIGGMPASRFLENLFTSKGIRSALAPWVPTRAANWVRRLRTRNLRRAPDLPPELRRELTAGFREDIEKTSGLIGRSLAQWL